MISLRSLLSPFVVVALVLGAAACSSDDEQDGSSLSAAEQKEVDTLVSRSQAQIGAEEYDDARATLDELLELDPGNAYGHYNLGLLEQQTGDADAATAAYDRALEVYPEFAAALYNRGVIAETGDVETAVDYFERAVASDPEMARAHMRLGFALLHLGRKAEGEEHLATGLRLDPAMSEVTAPSYG
ncbi:tetratricopeptide repeat protein [Nocardioides solisilvae]|uniref:tetratricopeptide repeat protein n=1 Tax=Nocardioides solisilvae TaxID=1542435 RepID=UPI0013A5B906|nr:tetratricopeptide repeat protein [Nocardioides solisilvae]